MTAWKNLFYSSLRSWGRCKISLQRGREEARLHGHGGRTRRNEGRAAQEVARGGSSVSIAGTCGTNTCQQWISCRGRCFGVLGVPVSPVSMHISLHMGRYKSQVGGWFRRYNYTGSVSGVVFFCFIFIVVGSAEWLVYCLGQIRCMHCDHI